MIDDLRADREYPHAELHLVSNLRTLVGVPLLKAGAVIGVIVLGRGTVKRFSDRDIELIRTFADCAALAWEKGMLLGEAKEAFERQEAVGQILSAIGRAGSDAHPVFELAIASAGRMCGAFGGILWLRDGEVLKYAAGWTETHSDVEALASYYRQRPISLTGDSRIAKALRAGGAAQIPDVQEEPGIAKEEAGLQPGVRTLLGVPLVKNDAVIGAITLARGTVKPFSEYHISLVRTFAAQAVLALENARLLNETNEALERQTAVSDVLSEMSRSAFDLGPVLQTVLDRAYRLSQADHGWLMRHDGEHHLLEAYHGDSDLMQRVFHEWSDRTIIPRGWTKRAITERRTQRVDDLTDEDTRFPLTVEEVDRLKEHFRSHPEDREDLANAGSFAQLTGAKKLLAVPLLRGETVLGVIVLTRSRDEQFSERQIEIVETFAQQAAIAIENVRLFNETKEALERQTATSEVLKVISGSAFDLQPVFETLIEKAVRLGGADNGSIARREGEELVYTAHAGRWTYFGDDDPMSGRTRQPIKAGRDQISGRVLLEGRSVQIPDIRADPEYDTDATTKFRAGLGVPILRAGELLGIIILRRYEPGPFSDKRIELLESFADQAAIAIENVRLFYETREKSAQLEGANRELASASRHKSEFLANMSHELRTPLNAIIGFSDVLEQRLFGELNERQADYTRDIASSGRHLLELVNEILDLSKVEAGRMALEPNEFALAETIHGAMAFIRERAATHSIALSADVHPDLGTVVADERKVRQVLLNLLSNAVKFTPDGGTINVQAHRGDGEVQVSVGDTGIGIAPEDQAKVFDEFQQVGKASDRSREGTGLGLTLAKRFIELHGGRIRIDSEVGKGTTFTFVLPADLAAP